MSRLSSSHRSCIALLLAASLSATPVCHATDESLCELAAPLRWWQQLVSWVLASGGSMDPDGRLVGESGHPTDTVDSSAVDTESGHSMDPDGR